ncbi:MAG: Sec-independent protein translocase subunit TatB [Algicola sp.]|nr:Sec-independent protein translocase subunit TatB [Algicola sp.]
MGMGELLIIAVIGLLVLGPERLPVAIKTVSGWIRSAKQMAGSISAEINHELKANELHQNLKKAEQQGLENLSPELNETMQELKDAAASVTRQYENIGSSESDESNKDQHPEKKPANENP